MASTPKPRNYLTLKKKVEVIKVAEKNRGMSTRELGDQFDCGKTQIAKILKNKESILSSYESNPSGSRVVSTKMSCRQSEYSDINKPLYTWYTLARSKNILPMGPQLVEKAKQIASCVGKHNFKGSNGWLDKWKKRYSVKQLRASGEVCNFQDLTVGSSKGRLPELIAGYAVDDIWSFKETGLFWKALPDQEFGVKVKECKGGEKSKQRFTVAFFVTASGKKERPVVIWNAENPTCLERFDKALLPVDYYSQNKAWMDGEIMESILSKLNYRLSSSSRFILLLMDDTDCHPENLKTKFSNIKVGFLAANSTLKLQPLDFGIIQNFKVHYRNFFLRYVLAKMDDCDGASDVSRSINVLVAISWVAMAWSLVEEESIKNGFRKAGVLDSDAALVVRDEKHPPDECLALQSLIDKTMSNGEACPLEVYVSADSGLPVCYCVDDDGDTWESTFFAHLGQEYEKRSDDSDEDDFQGTLDDQPPLKVNTYKEANKFLEETRRFLESQGHIREALKVGSIVDDVSYLQLSAVNRPATLDHRVGSTDHC